MHAAQAVRQLNIVREQTMLSQTVSRLTVVAAATLTALAGSARADISGFNSGVGYTVNASALPAPTFTPTTATLSQASDQQQATSLFFNTKQDISTGFVAGFTYQMTAVGAEGYTDGFTFAIQNNGLNALGGAGALLGFGGTGALTPAVAIAFDQNEGGPRREITKVAVGPGYSDANGRAIGPVLLESGHPIRVTLAYTAATGSLTETLLDQTTLATFSTTFTGLNLASTLGGPAAYVGFTASNGNGTTTATQVISDFSYTVVPEPTSLAAVAVSGLALLRRRRLSR